MKLYFLIVLSLLFCGHLQAKAATIEAIGGTSSIKVERQSKTLRLEVGATLEAGDIAETDGASVADIRYEDRSLVRLAKSTRYTIERKPVTTGKIISELLWGAVRILVPEQKDKTKIRLELHTPQSVIGVRGTEFLVEQLGERSDLYMLHGEVSFANAKNPTMTTLVAAGFKSHVHAGQAPSKPEAFSIPETLKRIDSTANLFGPLAERRHGVSAPAEEVETKKSNINVKSTPAAPTSFTGEAKLALTPAPVETKVLAGKKNDETNALFLQAAMNLKLKDLQELINKGADCKVRDDEGNSALHFAAIANADKDQDIVIQFLVKNNCDVNAVNNDHETALVMAITNADEHAKGFESQLRAVVEALVGNGADIQIQNRKHQTALQIAAKRGLKSIEALLR